MLIPHSVAGAKGALQRQLAAFDIDLPHQFLLTRFDIPLLLPSHTLPSLPYLYSTPEVERSKNDKIGQNAAQLPVYGFPHIWHIYRLKCRCRFDELIACGST